MASYQIYRIVKFDKILTSHIYIHRMSEKTVTQVSYFIFTLNIKPFPLAYFLDVACFVSDQYKFQYFIVYKSCWSTLITYPPSPFRAFSCLIEVPGLLNLAFLIILSCYWQFESLEISSPVS